MKKKVALLLVLSMLLSMIPMNVFGSAVTPGTVVPGAGVQGHISGEGNDSAVNLVFSLPVNHVVSRIQASPNNELNLNIDLYRARIMNQAGDGTQYGVPAAGIPLSAEVITPTGATTAALTVTLTAVDNAPWERTNAFVRVQGAVDDILNIAGTLRFVVPVRGQTPYWFNATATVRTTGVGVDTFYFINQWRISGAAVSSMNISVAAPGQRGFTSALHLPSIRLSENQFGVLDNQNHDMVIMLTAPQFYTWSFSTTATTTQDIVAGRAGQVNQLDIRAGGVGNGQSFVTVNADGTPGAQFPAVTNAAGSERSIPVGSNIWGTRHGGTGEPHAAGRHRVFIPLSQFTRSPAWRPGLGWIELRNLWLIPDANAPATGNVNIDVHVGRMGASHPNIYPIAGVNSWRDLIGNIPGAPTGQTGWAWVNGQWQLVPTTHPATQNMGPTWAPYWLGSGFDGVSAVREGQRTTGLHVGTRGNADLTVDVHDGPNDVRTGTLGAFRPQNFLPAPGVLGRHPDQYAHHSANWRWNRDNEGTPYFEGVMTSTLIIEENIPGGFVTGFGAPINFAFLDDEGNPHPGIRILGMEARAGSIRRGWTRGAMTHFWGGPQGAIGIGGATGTTQITGQPTAAGTWSDEGNNQNWMTFRGWVSALDQRLPNAPGVGRLSDTLATIYLPAQTITEVVPLPYHHGTGILEVRFYLSVEAGFEAKHGSNIDVTISGAGVANLVGANGSYTTTIAHARDPIAMSLVSGVTQIETGQLYNIQGGSAAVSDVIIDVVDNSAFGIGEELWIYIGTDTIGRNFDVNLLNIPTVHVNPESGLRLDTGRLMAPAVAGHVGRAGVAFTVTRQPYGGDAPAPVITISNIHVEGQAFPDVEYQIIVSGTGVANNDQEVFNAVRARQTAQQLQNVQQGAWGWDIAHAAAIAPMNRGVFTTLPYSATILENIAGGPWGHAPAPAPAPGPVGPGMATGEFRMWAGMGPIAGVDEPFRWVDLAGTNLRVGFVSARAFAYFVNGNPDVGVDWNAATNTATIAGQDSMGNAVQVTMTVGSNIAQVNGVPVDIATFAGQSGPANSIQVVPTPDGRIFLPLRFLANAFGRTVQADGEIVVFR